MPAAIMMILFMSWIVTRSVRARTGFDVAIVLFLLVMMVAMLIGPAYLYLTTLDLTLGDVVIWEIAVFMSVGMMPIGFLLFAKFWIEGDSERKKPLPLSGLLRNISYLRASYIGLLVASEFFMGWSFNLATGVLSLTSRYSAALIGSQVTYTLASYWFIFTMAGEMTFTLAALWRSLRPGLRYLLALQSVVMFLTPTAISSRLWETYALYGEAAAMTVLIVFVFAYLRRNAAGDHPLLSYTAIFIVANAAMMAAFFWWLVTGEAALLAGVLVAETIVYFDALLTGSGVGATFRGGPIVPPVPVPPALPLPGVS